MSKKDKKIKTSEYLKNKKEKIEKIEKEQKEAEKQIKKNEKLFSNLNYIIAKYPDYRLSKSGNPYRTVEIPMLTATIKDLAQSSIIVPPEVRKQDLYRDIIMRVYKALTGESIKNKSFREIKDYVDKVVGLEKIKLLPVSPEEYYKKSDLKTTIKAKTGKLRAIEGEYALDLIIKYGDELGKLRDKLLKINIKENPEKIDEIIRDIRKLEYEIQSKLPSKFKEGNNFVSRLHKIVETLLLDIKKDTLELKKAKEIQEVLDKQLKQLTDEKKKNEERIKELQKKIEQLKQKAKTDQSAKKEIEKLQKKIKILEAEYKGKEEQIKELKLKLGYKDDALKSYKKVYKKLDKKTKFIRTLFKRLLLAFFFLITYMVTYQYLTLKYYGRMVNPLKLVIGIIKTKPEPKDIVILLLNVISGIGLLVITGYTLLKNHREILKILRKWAKWLKMKFRKKVLSKIKK